MNADATAENRPACFLVNFVEVECDSIQLTNINAVLRSS